MQNTSFLKKFTCVAKERPKSAPKERSHPISVASEQGLDTSIQANIQTAATKVTDIGWLLSLGASAFSKNPKNFQKSERFSPSFANI